MQLVYSALKTTHSPTRKIETPIETKYKAYETTCNKYAHEIAAIQKYIPNWQPKFNY